ncbi:M15 family metallopeptidase [Cognatiluteimonas weifangensis]|uniref:D-alanyl-D-alanine carboxypeptidase family protein n=1 Tax=Cognatiluteimonas weifangensis TaxID=2303539 RepID=A0A372DK28_9GAMM|nr:M15 family metallopeptidase [Luteimonas weifangensis]RFP59903.1 D-alanyl-D-alanine carboxypeptidase family protein [Luteimonas weifangensis]
MRAVAGILLNTDRIEIWPGGLLRARSNADARLLARARHVLRRKRDGRYLAADLPEGLQPLLPALRREPGIDAALAALRRARAPRRPGIDAVATLPLQRLRERLQTLGLDDGYGARSGLPLVPEPDRLALAGRDRYRRPLWLRADAARAWTRLRAAALRDGVVLEAISGYRSHDYQLGIFERKLARGLSVEEILTVNAAPGYSEHHGGLALDLGTPDEPPAEESFERTPAFAWLRAHAAGHGFGMSYPRDNPHGIVYEPWHWAYAPG